MPRNVTISSWLLGIAAVLGVALAVGAARSGNHVNAGSAAYLAIAKDEDPGLIEPLGYALGFEIVVGVIAAILLSVMAAAVRRRRPWLRVVTWWGSLAVLVMTGVAAGTDASTEIAGGGFDSAVIERAAEDLLPGWYAAVVEVAELGIIAATLGVLVLLARSSVLDFYRSERVSNQPGLWVYAARDLRAPGLGRAPGAQQIAEKVTETGR
jgi:hypothetical protein